jgi:type IV secretion system protein VirB11
VTPRQQSAARGFQESLGPISALLAEETLTDLHRNADGAIHVRYYGAEPEQVRVALTDAQAHSIVRLAADLAGTVVTEDRPLIRSTLPDGSRFQGVIPPVSPAPAFSIRRHRVRDLSLDDVVRQEILTADQCAAIRVAIERRQNILITGETGVGKTTLLNAMLREPSVMAGRLFIAEDTREIRAPGPDVVQLCTSDTVSLRDLVLTALRMRPDRIVIGETRSGDAAVEMLKAWTTAHRGGFSTLHAESAGAFVLRLTTLLQEVVAGGTDALIGYAVDLVVHLVSTPSGPRCTELLSVAWEDGVLSLHANPQPTPGGRP